MPGVASLGIGTGGLDLNAMLDQFEAMENRRLEPLQEQLTTCEAQISGFGKLQSSLEKLKAASEALKKFGDISTTKVNGEYKSFDVKTDGKAVPGVYDILVTQLAKAQTIATKDGFATNKELIGNNNAERTITITQKSGKNPIVIKLKKDQTSLIELQDAINKSDSNVSAGVVKTKDGKFHLVITSKTEGTDSSLNIKVDGDDQLASVLDTKSVVGADGKVSLDGSVGGMEQKTMPQNAELEINGFEFESQTNQIKDQFPGLTLTLKKTSENKQADHLIISEDPEPATKKIKEWVDAYNEYQKLCSELTKYTQAEKGEGPSKTNGPLIGNSTLRGIQNHLRGQIRTSQDTGSDLNLLNKMGIKQKVDGTLEIDDKKLEKALKENSSSVKTFFAGDGKTTGFGTETFNYLKDVLEPREGTLHTATDGLEKRKKGIGKRIEQTKEQIQNSLENYKRQFQNLDKMMSSLNGTSGALSRLLG